MHIKLVAAKLFQGLIPYLIHIRDNMTINNIIAKVASSTLADIRKEDLAFSFSIWIQPKDLSSDSNTTPSNYLEKGLQDLSRTG